MQRHFALPLLAGLAACGNVTPSQQARIAQAITVACNVDGVLVPVAQPVVASLGPGGTTVANVDTLLVHPTVVAACTALKGTPASATPAAPPVAAAPPSTN
jgi:hypothetical protein